MGCVVISKKMQLPKFKLKKHLVYGFILGSCFACYKNFNNIISNDLLKKITTQTGNQEASIVFYPVLGD